MSNGFRCFPRSNPNLRFVDPDRRPEQEELEWISHAFLQRTENILGLSLDCRQIFSAQESKKRHRLRWITPLGQHASQTQSGPLCCPVCLSEDITPYFRISWRFAFQSHCPLHGTPMIDRCHTCGGMLWPASARQASPNEWYGLHQCRKCGADLRIAPYESGSASDVSYKLMRCESHCEIPAEICQASSPSELFAALWVMCQLLLRRQSFHLWGYIPSEIKKTAFAIDATNKPYSIELLPFQPRAQVIRAAYWLLCEWPSRFFGIVQKAKITRVHLSQTESIHPPWLEDVIEHSLTHKRRNAISTEQVQATISALKASEGNVTKAAVRRAFRVSENREINASLSQRRHATTRELLLFCGKFEKRLKTTPASRDQHNTLLRDYLIFLLSVIGKIPVEDVCLITLEKFDVELRLPSGLAPYKNEVGRLLANRAKELGNIYATQIRPVWLTSSSNFNVWFVSRFGEPMEGHSVRDRIAKMMRSGFPDNLWRSADIFMFSLEENAPLGRRALRLRGSKNKEQDQPK